MFPPNRYVNLEGYVAGCYPYLYGRWMRWRNFEMDPSLKVLHQFPLIQSKGTGLGALGPIRGESESSINLHSFWYHSEKISRENIVIFTIFQIMYIFFLSFKLFSLLKFELETCSSDIYVYKNIYTNKKSCQGKMSFCLFF